MIYYFVLLYLGLSGTVVFHSPPAKLARVGDIVGDLMRKVNVSYSMMVFVLYMVYRI